MKDCLFCMSGVHHNNLLVFGEGLRRGMEVVEVVEGGRKGAGQGAESPFAKLLRYASWNVNG